MRSIVFSFFLCPLFVLAQVGIGTNGIENASAKLEVKASNQGFLPPRVALQGTDDASLSTPSIASPATGLLVYNTATAGTGTTAVTPGFYFYDGSRWQRIINQQPDATVEFTSSDNNPNTGGTTFTGTERSRDLIYVSAVNGSQWTYNGSLYVTYTPPASTPWLLSGGTSDAGSNKTASVYRSGSVGIGSATTPNASAQLDVNSTTKGFLPPRMTRAQRIAITSPATGLIVYQTDASSGTIPGLYCYNGSAWNILAATVYSEVHANENNTASYTDNASFNEFSLTIADNVKGLFGSSYGFVDGTGSSGSNSDRWVAPYSGKFRVTTTVYFNQNATYPTPRFVARKNNADMVNMLGGSNSATDITLSTSSIVSLNQNEYINWRISNGASIWRGPYHTFFRVESVE